MTLRFFKAKIEGETRLAALILGVVSLLWLALNAGALLKYPTVVSDESLVALVSYRMTTAGQASTVSQTHRAVIENIMRLHHITTVLMDENLGLMPEVSSNEPMREALREYLAANCELQGVVSRIAYGIDFNGPGKKETRVYVCTP